MSWAVGSGASGQTYSLSMSGVEWVCWQTLPRMLQPEELLQYLHEKYPQGFLVRGVPTELWAHWRHEGLHAITSGLEAALPPYPELWGKSSLRQLCRRGLRWGQVRELAPKAIDRARYARFIENSNIGHRPLLRGMYRDQAADAQRCFVFEDENGNWLALVTLTRNATHRWHVELMQRSLNAPVGVMEATLLTLYAALHAEREDNRLTLGEVPFMHTGGGCLSKLTRLAGQAVKPGYYYPGLYRFKDKFKPHWQPLRIVCTKPITPLTMAELMFATGAHRVMWRGWWDKMKNSF
ncbi:MAG: phosphatidylglycerol lysyltransferase domain-containing protein [Bacteroidota bacterium]